MRNKICLIYNFAQHYRSNIFILMDNELTIDFVFGNKFGDVKKMDYSLLKNVKEVTNATFIIKPLTYQRNVLQLFEKYSTFIMLGDLHCISTWIMLFLGNFFNKKIYLWSHGWYGKEGKIKSIIKKIFFQMAEGIFLYGNHSKKLMIQNGFKEEKLHLIHNSLMYDIHLELRNHLCETYIFKNYFKNLNKVILFIGRLTAEKQLDMLLNVIAKLKINNKNFNLVLIGTGEKEFELKNLAVENNILDTTWFYGECYDEKVLAELIYNADLCVSPGNVGLTAVHALTFGTPVITHNNFSKQMPEFEAIEENVTGKFFIYNNLDSLSQSIEDWFSQDNNRNQIRKNCFKKIDECWNPQYQINVFKKVLLKV